MEAILNPAVDLRFEAEDEVVAIIPREHKEELWQALSMGK